MKNSSLLLGLCLFSIILINCQNQPNNKKAVEQFNFARYVFGGPPSLYAYVKSIDQNSGEVILRGGDSRKPEAPFIFEWGDSAVTIGIFPQEHIYTDHNQNYIIKVKALYPDSSSDSTETFVRFAAPQVKHVAIDDKITVTIPNSKIELGSRLPPEGMYKLSESLSYFTDDFFLVIPRKTIEYILSVVAHVQMNFVNNNVYMTGDTFRQVLLRDAGFGGMYSLWFTNPVSFGVGDYGLQGTIQWSSFFHEMGHNFTLNTPGGYYFGGKTDGNANAIYSETMAQIFQHVTAYHIVNNYSKYGLGEDLACEIKLSANSSFSVLSRIYQRYINSGKNYSSWNDPNTPQDETFDTFMTIAYKFFEHAEKGKLDYENRLKRMMKFLQQFNQDWLERYDPMNDSTEGSSFRATFMVSALSYAFEKDLRAEFKEIKFPIDDDIYEGLLADTD